MINLHIKEIYGLFKITNAVRLTLYIIELL